MKNEKCLRLRSYVSLENSDKGEERKRWTLLRLYSQETWEGTKTRLGLFSISKDKYHLLLEKTFPSKQYKGLEIMVKEFLGGKKTASACFGRGRACFQWQGKSHQSSLGHRHKIASKGIGAPKGGVNQ